MLSIGDLFVLITQIFALNKIYLDNIGIFPFSTVIPCWVRVHKKNPSRNLCCKKLN